MIADKNEMTWMVLPWEGGKQASGDICVSVYQAHVVTQESAPALIEPFPQKPYSIPLIASKKCINGGRNRDVFGCVEDHRPFFVRGGGHWERRMALESLYNVSVLGK